MKKIFLAVATALAMFSCSQKEPVTVTITNPLSIDRNGEMVEISMAEITGKLQLHPIRHRLSYWTRTGLKYLIR